MSTDNTTISVNWLTGRVDDDIVKNLEGIKYNLIGMSLSNMGSEFDSAFNIDNYVDRVVYDNEIIKTRNGDNSHFSPGATIAALFGPSFKEFVIPPDILAYIKTFIQSEEEKNLYLKRIPQTDEQFDKAKEYYDIFTKANFPSQSAYLLIGAIWVECGFNANLYNKDEAKGNKGVVESAKGMANCGEGIFGLTFWKQKEKLIKSLSLDTIPRVMYMTLSETDKRVDKNNEFMGTVPSNPQRYMTPQRGVEGNLYQLKEDTWIDILKEYIYKIPKLSADKKSTFDYIMYDGVPNPKSTDEEDDDHTLFYSCYLFKAATGASRTFKSVKDWSERYMSTHKNIATGKGNANAKIDNGFVKQVLVAYVVAKYCTGTPREEINFDELA